MKIKVPVGVKILRSRGKGKRSKRQKFVTKWITVKTSRRSSYEMV